MSYSRSDRLIIIIPCYNEEEVLPNSISRLLTIMPSASLLCIDDGSQDRTWEIIKKIHHENPAVIGIKLLRNYGQQEAFWAGLAWAADHYDAIITLDADLQDDPRLIPDMVEQYAQGADLVLAVRDNRESDTPFKKWSAALFYHLAGRRLIPQHGDFRLLSQKAVRQLLTCQPEKPFLRALVPHLGIPYITIPFKREKRAAGKSKYSLIKMIRLAGRLYQCHRRATTDTASHYQIEEILHE